MPVTITQFTTLKNKWIAALTVINLNVEIQRMLAHTPLVKAALSTCSQSKHGCLKISFSRGL